VFIHAGKSADVSVAPTNQIVDAEVSHALNPFYGSVNEMAESKRDFDIKLIEAVKLTPILWDSRLDDYKLSEKKPALWLEIADKLGSSAGRPIHTVQM